MESNIFRERIVGAGVVFLFLGGLLFLDLDNALELLTYSISYIIFAPIAVFVWTMKTDNKWKLYLIKLPLNLVINIFITGAFIHLIISWYTTKDTIKLLQKMEK